MADNKYVIVTTVNRETSVNFTETLEQAKELMVNDYNEWYKQYIDVETGTNCGIGDTNAWISIDDLWYDIDIFEIK